MPDDRAIARTVPLGEAAAALVGRATGAFLGGLGWALDRQTGRGFDPGRPLTAVLPPGSAPRDTEVRVGRNYNIQPRSEDPRLTPFDLLRHLTRSPSSVTATIAAVKRTITGTA